MARSRGGDAGGQGLRPTMVCRLTSLPCFPHASLTSSSASSSKKTLIVPDKDADGLTAGVLLHRTLTALGLSPSLIDVHLLPKGSTVHDEPERAAMHAKHPAFVIVVDQGSRAGPPVVPGAEALVVDHHLSDEFPEEATVVSACHCPPVATSSLLTYEICKTLAEKAIHECAYL